MNPKSPKHGSLSIQKIDHLGILECSGHFVEGFPDPLQGLNILKAFSNSQRHALETVSTPSCFQQKGKNKLQCHHFLFTKSLGQPILNVKCQLFNHSLGHLF